MVFAQLSSLAEQDFNKIIEDDVLRFALEKVERDDEIVVKLKRKARRKMMKRIYWEKIRRHLILKCNFRTSN